MHRQVSLRISKEMVENLDEHAKADHRTRNNLITLILREWLAEKSCAKLTINRMESE